MQITVTCCRRSRNINEWLRAFTVSSINRNMHKTSCIFSVSVRILSTGFQSLFASEDVNNYHSIHIYVKSTTKQRLLLRSHFLSYIHTKKTKKYFHFQCLQFLHLTEGTQHNVTLNKISVCEREPFH